MPLIMMTGYPSSGKTTRARELKALLEARLSSPAHSKLNLKVDLINDQTLGVPRSAYAHPSEEKKARGALISAVERLVSRETILIVDSLNYIKGLRYQLYCASREMSTPHCVIHCAIPIDEARRINDGRGDDKYPDSVFDELVMRYEEPNHSARWDSPLFTIIQHDRSDKIPFEDIWRAVVEKRAPPPNFATAAKPVTETNYLFELDRATQLIVNAVLEAQKSGVPMSEVKVPGAEIPVMLPSRSLSLVELRRIRKQFTNVNKLVSLKIERIPALFVEYLNASL